MSGEQAQGPPARVRVVGQAATWLIARYPRTWPLLRGPVRRFFDAVAPDWERRVAAPNRMEPLAAALEGVGVDRPSRILDLGTGTGAAARWLAARFPQARVVGVDLSPEMIRVAREQTSAELAERIDYRLGDASQLALPDAGFDLVVQVSVPPFFAEAARLLAPGGHLAVVSSIGSATPFHTPPALLRRGFARRGLVEVAAGVAGAGTYWVARKPG